MKQLIQKLQQLADETKDLTLKKEILKDIRFVKMSDHETITETINNKYGL